MSRILNNKGRELLQEAADEVNKKMATDHYFSLVGYKADGTSCEITARVKALRNGPVDLPVTLTGCYVQISIAHFADQKEGEAFFETVVSTRAQCLACDFHSFTVSAGWPGDISIIEA